MDSKFWSRGIERRGFLVTLIVKANYKKSYFLGREVLPGQIACSLKKLEEDLEVSHGTLYRMLHEAKSDGLLIWENADNRYTVITLCNWETYNSMENGARTTDGTTGGQLTVQLADTSKEGKKEKKEEEEYTAEFVEWWERYPKKVGKGAAWKAWRNVGGDAKLPDILASLDSWLECDDWARGFICLPATWLNQRRWEDDPPKAKVRYHNAKDEAALRHARVGQWNPPDPRDAQGGM